MCVRSDINIFPEKGYHEKFTFCLNPDFHDSEGLYYCLLHHDILYRQGGTGIGFSPNTSVFPCQSFH